MSKKKLARYYRIFVLIVFMLFLYFSVDFAFSSTENMDWNTFTMFITPGSWMCLILLIISYPGYRFWRNRIKE